MTVNPQFFNSQRTLGEESSVTLDKLAGHGGSGQTLEGFAVVSLLCANGNLLDLVDGQVRRSSQAFDDDLCTDSLLDVVLDLLKDLSGEDDNGGGTVTNFSILRSGNVDEDSGGRVNNVEELPGTLAYLVDAGPRLKSNLPS